MKMAVQRPLGAGSVGKQIVDHYNFEALLELISQLATTIQSVRDQDLSDVQNQITNLQQLLNQKVQDLQGQIDEVRTLAQVLDDYEKGQIEKILDDVFHKLAAEGLINRLCLTLPTGENVSLKDLLVKLTFAERVIGRQYVYDPETEQLTGIKLVVTDGMNTREEILNYKTTQDVTDANGNLLYKVDVFETNNWGGTKATVQKKIYYLPRAYTVSFANQQITKEVRLYVGEDDIVLSLDVQACPYQTEVDQAIEQAVDINHDGVIGPNKQAQQQSSTANQTSGTSTADKTTSGTTDKTSSSSNNGG